MSLSSETYLGVDVLDARLPFDSDADNPTRRVAATAPEPGPVWLQALEVEPRYRRSLLIHVLSAGELADLIRWMDRCRGRALPFWLPSWDVDLRLAAGYDPAGAAPLELAIAYAGYAEVLFPAGTARRHLAISLPSGDLAYRRVTGASGAAPGPETLTLDAALPAALPAGAALSFLRWCRLDTDEARLELDASASCSLPVLELPEECPA